MRSLANRSLFTKTHCDAGALDRGFNAPCRFAPRRGGILHRAVLLITLVPALFVLPGCSPLNFNLKNFSFNNDEKPVTPTRMIPVWTDTVLTRAGQPGVRGFGGRVVFYQNEKQQPVRVDGSLVVYAWDDTDAAELSDAPDRKYVITAEQLAAHFSESRIGPSYSIWIPWDEVGGEHRKVSLVTRFIGANGAEVVSQPMNAVLPGPMEDRMLVTRRSSLPLPLPLAPVTLQAPAAALQDNLDLSGSVQQASWQTASNAPSDPPSQPRMKTTTFDVSPAFAAHHFGDNRAPLNPDAAASSFTETSRGTAAPIGHAPSTDSERTPRPARTAPRARPVPSPLRNQPHRATWQSRHPATPQWRNETSTPESPGPEPDGFDPPPAGNPPQSRS